nr:PREDICTED: protocadherin-10-like [Opisthocomus hoazin]
MIVLFLFVLLWMVEGALCQLHYTVQEEQEHGTFVGNIAEDLGLDITKLSARRFQTAPNSRSPYLELNLETGVLYVNEKIDREQICKQSPSCLLHLEVFLENPLELFRVEIEVLDINDNPPAFPEPDLTVEISESATPGTRFPLESAFDPDVVSGELDYEESSVYQVYVQAKDLGPNAVPAHCKVLVRVLDANDNAPEISFSTVKEAVSEAAAPGTVVALFSVSDRDSEENGQVQCELLQGDAPFRLKSSFKNYYTIVTEGPLDREQPGGDAYTLTVVARDRGQPPPRPSQPLHTKHQRAELSYLVDRPRRVNSSAFQEADIVSSKDSGHGDSEQGDSDHDATNRGQSSGMDLFSNCTEECKALGHSDRCWMPSFVPSDGRQAADYRSNLHVPGMDSVPDTEVFETPEAQPGTERSFSTFGKEKALHNTLERKELDGLLSNTRAPYKPPYLN